MVIEANAAQQSGHETEGGKDRPKTIPTTNLITGIPYLWELAFDASPDLISIHDINHRILAVNKAMADAMGRPREELIGCKCHDVVHKSHCPLPSCPHAILLKDGMAHQKEIYEKSLDTWLLISVNPIHDDTGRLIGSIHIARNINDQKRDQQAVKESEERFHHLSEATMEGVLLSEDSNIITANQVLATMTGYGIDELEGMSLFKLIAPHQHERLILYLKKSQTGVYTFESIRKDGTQFPVQAHVQAVTYKNKMVYQTAIRDLTEQKKMEAERTNHERMQGVLQMAGAICHEINQPMMALYGYFDLLEEMITDDQPNAHHKIQKIRDQMTRIEKIIHQLMHITQYKTKSYAGGEEIIDIDQSADEGLDQMPE